MSKPSDSSAKESEKPSAFDKAKGWLVGITGVLVVVPALINAGIDVYAAIAKVPKSESERRNVELFKKYFNKQPVAAFPVPIKQSNGTVEVRFSIFDEGDVFVEFGKFTQWFPFPSVESKIGRFQPIAEAVAQVADGPKGFGRYTQSDRLEGNAIVRERTFENGVIEKSVIDPRTGEVTKFDSRRAPGAGAGAQKSSGVANIAPIDLDAARSGPATDRNRPNVHTCETGSGTCRLLTPVPAGAACACYGSSGSIVGRAK